MTCRWRWRPRRGWAPGRPTARCWGCGGGRAWAEESSWTASAGRGAARRGDRPHRRAARRSAVLVRPARLHGGVRGARRHGAQGAQGRRARVADDAVRAHGDERQGPAHQRRLDAGARSRRMGWPSGSSQRAVRMLGAGIASAVNLLDVEAVIIGGGLGTRLGEPYVERITPAMQPHLFVSQRPPDRATGGAGRAVRSHRRGAARRARAPGGLSSGSADP